MPASALPPSIALGQGEARVIELPGQGIGGYAWTAELIEGHMGIEELPADPADTAALGAPARARFRLSATGSGKARIRFSLSRPWEKGETASVHELTVTIGP